MALSVVEIGASKKDGGSRSHSVRFGGATAMPFHLDEGFKSVEPVVAHDVFDMAIPLPTSVRECFGEALKDPVEWAKKNVEDYKAEAITLHMISTDPKQKDTSVKDACATVESFLKEVKAPLIIAGSGNPEKDSKLLVEAAETASGERCLLSSVDLKMDYQSVAKAALEHGHSILSLASMNPEEMRRINLNLIREGLTDDKIVMDLFTGGVGYGIEYTVSAMEQARLKGLGGVEGLGSPIASATSNAWSCREAWMRRDEWGPREYRGPLWEETTALVTLLAGADLFMMLHPQAIADFKNYLDKFYTKEKDESRKQNPDKDSRKASPD
ncbi:CO dehydrogenase/acetyl-CoA synthase subunit delta [Candidatus Altiarchaeota archaeon]